MSFAAIAGILLTIRSSDGLRETGFFLIAVGLLALYARRRSNPRINQLKNLDALRTDFSARYLRNVGNYLESKQSLYIALSSIVAGFAFIFIN
jgi:hypothetical protein